MLVEELLVSHCSSAQPWLGGRPILYYSALIVAFPEEHSVVRRYSPRPVVVSLEVLWARWQRGRLRSRTAAWGLAL